MALLLRRGVLCSVLVAVAVVSQIAPRVQGKAVGHGGHHHHVMHEHHGAAPPARLYGQSAAEELRELKRQRYTGEADFRKLDVLGTVCRSQIDWVQCNAANLCAMVGIAPTPRVAFASACDCLAMCRAALMNGDGSRCWMKWNEPSCSWFFDITADGTVVCDPSGGSGSKGRKRQLLGTCDDEEANV